MIVCTAIALFLSVSFCFHCFHCLLVFSRGQAWTAPGQRPVSVTVRTGQCLDSVHFQSQSGLYSGSMRISHSIIVALHSVLKQCGLKCATNTLEGFVREIDHVAPWYNLPHKSSTLLRGTYCLCLVYLTCIRDYFQCTYKCSCIRSQFPLTVRSILVS